MRIYYDFRTDIGFDYKQNKKPFTLLKRVFIRIEKEKRVQWLTIPQGFNSDGCSIPKLFRFLLGCPHTPKYVPASIIHDYLLEKPEIVRYDRKTASLIFFHALLKEGVCPAQAVIMYLAVDLWQRVKNLWTEKWV